MRIITYLLLALFCAGMVRAAGSRLASRIGKAPAPVLAELMKLDGRDDYTAYTPTANEQKLVAECLEQLPPLNRRVLQERLQGIYFVNAFARGGYTGQVMGKNGKVSAYLAFSPQVLSVNLTEYLSFQELSLFSQGDPYTDITVDCGNERPAMLYLLLRESTHVVDLVQGITAKPNAFTDGIWQSADEPVKTYNFRVRTKLNFSGLDGDTAISYDKAKDIYPQWHKTPFISLRASWNRAEDLAEFVAFYHLTKKLGTPYKLTLHHDFAKVEVWQAYEPMKEPLIMQRFPAMAMFYQKGK